MEPRNLRIERKKQRIEENRVFILKAAEKVFAEKGYLLATVDAIAGEVQFSKATLYRYFKSKRDILFEIILDSFREVLQRLQKIKEKEESAEEKLKEIIRFILHYFHKKQNISRIFLMERVLMRNVLHLIPEEKSIISFEGKEFLAELRATKMEMLKIMSEVFEEGIKAGEFRKMNTLDASHAFEAILHGFHFTRFWHEKEYSHQKGSDLIQDFILYGIKKRL